MLVLVLAVLVLVLVLGLAAGEFNAGKSTIINALLGGRRLQVSSHISARHSPMSQHKLPARNFWSLLGGRHLQDGITPTTDRVTLIKHAPTGSGGAGGARLPPVATVSHWQSEPGRRLLSTHAAHSSCRR